MSGFKADMANCLSDCNAPEVVATTTLLTSFDVMHFAMWFIIPEGASQVIDGIMQNHREVASLGYSTSVTALEGCPHLIA